jgi:hypothetical protein
MAARKKPAAYVAWNKGLKASKSDRQHFHVPRDDVPLFLAVCVYFAGPVYAAAVWFTMVSSRRVSEALRLSGSDLCLDGGEHHDKPHIWFGQKEGHEAMPGLGKLPSGQAIARLPAEAVAIIRGWLDKHMAWEVGPALEQIRTSHPSLFLDVSPLNKAKFQPTLDDKLLFPSLKRGSKQPWMTRQSVWNAVGRTRGIMFKLTGHRRYNPDAKFNGAHVHVHGATRHTASALLLHSPTKSKRPSDHAIMEVQQREDLRTFQKHYHHVNDADVESALNFAWVDPQFALAAAEHTTAGETCLDQEPATAAETGLGQVRATTAETCAAQDHATTASLPGTPAQGSAAQGSAAQGSAARVRLPRVCQAAQGSAASHGSAASQVSAAPGEEVDPATPQGSAASQGSDGGPPLSSTASASEPGGFVSRNAKRKQYRKAAHQAWLAKNRSCAD